MVCKTYENCVDGNDWKIIYENDTITQFEIAKLAHKRIQKGLQIMENQDLGIRLYCSGRPLHNITALSVCFYIFD